MAEDGIDIRSSRHVPPSDRSVAQPSDDEPASPVETKGEHLASATWEAADEFPGVDIPDSDHPVATAAHDDLSGGVHRQRVDNVIVSERAQTPTGHGIPDAYRMVVRSGEEQRVVSLELDIEDSATMACEDRTLRDREREDDRVSPVADFHPCLDNPRVSPNDADFRLRRAVDGLHPTGDIEWNRQHADGGVQRSFQ